MSAPFVSVVIPVYGAAEGLDACLACLSRQTYPRFEVIVVDNGCPTIERARGCRVVREARPGSYAARNAGVQAARGEVIAFTDDDCLPHPDWLERGVESLGAADATGIVAGPIVFVEPRPAGVSPTAYRYSALLSFRPEGAGGFGATANLFVRRAVLDAVGPFDPAFLSGGDMAWGRRAQERGFPTRYSPAARVGHQARRSVGAILRRELRLAGGDQTKRLRRGPPGRGRMLLEIVRIELRKLRWALDEVRSLDAGDRARLGALVALVHVLRGLERVRVLAGGAARRA